MHQERRKIGHPPEGNKEKVALQVVKAQAACGSSRRRAWLAQHNSARHRAGGCARGAERQRMRCEVSCAPKGRRSCAAGRPAMQSAPALTRPCHPSHASAAKAQASACGRAAAAARLTLLLPQPAALCCLLAGVNVGTQVADGGAPAGRGAGRGGALAALAASGGKKSLFEWSRAPSSTIHQISPSFTKHRVCCCMVTTSQQGTHRLMASSTAALASKPSGSTRHRLRMPRYSPASAERLQGVASDGWGEELEGGDGKGAGGCHPADGLCSCGAGALAGGPLPRPLLPAAECHDHNSLQPAGQSRLIHWQCAAHLTRSLASDSTRSRLPTDADRRWRLGET